MAHIVERLNPQRKRLALMLAGGAACAAIGWLLIADRAPAPARDGLVEQTQVVALQPFSASIGFTGTIVAGEAIGIFAPFDGAVKRVGFTYGDRVGAGQMLVELDPAELQQSRNDAEGAYLKASQAAAELAGWESGPEVGRVRRAAALASADLRETDRKIHETRELLDKGLVPRSEYDGLIQQRRSQQVAVTAAQEDLAATLARGRGDNRRVAELALANARSRLAEMNSQFNGAIIRALDEGIIIRPPTSKMDGDTGGIRPGMLVGKGQPIGSIARAGGLSAKFRVDEGDVGALKPGLPVTVTGPGFGGVMLAGRISSVAGEADADAASGKPGFTAVARLDPLTPEQARQIRIGMTANIAITTYNNAAALVVPPQAVQGVAPAATIFVRDQSGATPRAVIVQIGRVGPGEVEILSGIKPGDTVVWHTAAAPAAPVP